MKRVIIFFIIFFLFLSFSIISCSHANDKSDVIKVTQKSTNNSHELIDNKPVKYEFTINYDELKKAENEKEFLERYNKDFLPELIKKYGNKFQVIKLKYIK